MFGKKAFQPLAGPLPPLGLLDYESTMKFREDALEQYRANGWDTAVLLDWMIRTLLSSLMADSASRVFLLAPVWNNRETAETLHQATRRSVEELAGGEAVGVYLKELNLAIVDGDPHESLCCRFLGQGAIVLDSYSLRDLAPILRTDGQDWFVTEEDGEESYCPVLEPRMAALYRLGLERYYPKLLAAQREEK